MTPPSAERPASATFRDPQGRLVQQGDSVCREVYPQHSAQVLAWLQFPLARRWIAEGRLVPTEVAAQPADGSLLLRHERIFFPSYPWEWTPSQWHAAAGLTLDLCSEAVDEGFILKDATPLNILFSGARPVFVDVLSCEPRDPASPLWMAYAQFVRSFLLPLAAWRYLGWPLAASLHRRDGYEPADLAPWLPFLRRWRSPLRSLVALPLLLQGNAFQQRLGTAEPSAHTPPEAATWTLHRTLRSCRRMLRALAAPSRSSRWSNYTRTATHYSAEAQSAKQDFVRRSLQRIHPETVLDIGANTGVYSRIAAACGASVVAWDTDLQSAEVNAQTALQDNLPILSLVADFARPTPAVGWQNAEALSLVARAEGRFDCVLMLGVLHHLLLADQLPLDAILDQLARLTRRWAIVEWVPRDDAQFAGLSRGREALYSHLDEAFFTDCLTPRFATRSREQLSNGRTVWLLEKIG